MTMSQCKRQIEKLIQALRKFVNSTLSARMPFVSRRKPTESMCLRSHHAAVMSSCPSVTASRNTSPNLDKISTASPQRQRTQTLPDIHSSQSCSRSRNKTEQTHVQLRFITNFLGGEKDNPARWCKRQCNALALTHLQSATMTN